MYLSVAFLLAACVDPPAPASAGPEIQSPFSVNVEVDMVLVPVVVRDRNGVSLHGLPKSDFHVFEDGIPQEIVQFDNQDAPIAMGLVLDNSGSMRPKLGEVMVAAAELARNSNPHDQVFVIHFNEDVDFGLPVGEPFTSDLEELEAAVARTSPSGKTALYDAIVAGLEHLEQSPLQRKALVVVSDGGDNASHNTLLHAEDLAAGSQSVIYSIFVRDENSRETRPRILKRLAKLTGGIFFHPDTIELLPQIGKRIATDLRSQYTLGYVSTNTKKDGTFRNVHVIVATPDHRQLLVRTRRGYLAPKDAEQRAGEFNPPLGGEPEEGRSTPAIQGCPSAASPKPEQAQHARPSLNQGIQSSEGPDPPRSCQ